MRDGPVFITKNSRPQAVLLSVDAYTALTEQDAQALNQLTAEFDAMLLRMQAPGAREAAQAAFDASPAELGEAAVAAARKRA